MKFIHFADYHLGVESGGMIDKNTGMPSRVLDYLDILDSLVEFAEQEKIDLILFAGDAYHRSNPSPTYMVEFSKRIAKMAQLCPVVLLVGNHDAPGSVEKASAIDVFDTLSIPNVIVGKDYEIIELELAGEKIEIATFPYPFKSKVLKFEQAKDYIHRDDIVKDFCRKTISNFANQMSKDANKIFLGHLSVDTATYSSERMYMAGEDSHVDVNHLLDFDYVALGHIHVHQVLNDNPPVIYAGSLERVDFGEEHDKKGFVYGTIVNHKVTWEFVEVDARPYTTLKYNYVDEIPNKPTNAVVKNIESMDLAGHIVRIIIDVPSQYAYMIHLERITAALESVGVFSIRGINVVRKVPKDGSSRFEKMSGKSISEYTPTQLLDMWFDELEIDKIGKKKLMKLAEIVIEEVNNV